MNLEAENRNGYLVSAEMKRVWNVLIILLKRLLEVCEKYDLRIWGDGGTMLGTVREHGFIPWDDDIDMVLLRPDYDKLVQIAPKEFSAPFFFQCAYTDKNYTLGHSQLRMDGTTAITPSQVLMNVPYHLGIFIDIFPYDAVPDNPEEGLDQLKTRETIMLDLRRRSRGWDMLHPIRSCVNEIRRPLLLQKYAEYEDLFRRFRIDENQYVSCYSFQVDPEHFLRDKHWYDETVYLPFEDVMMPLPKDYDKILTLQYGDYMTPVKSPSYHGSFWKLTADKSYQDTLLENKETVRRMRLNYLKDRMCHVLHIDR